LPALHSNQANDRVGIRPIGSADFLTMVAARGGC